MFFVIALYLCTFVAFVLVWFYFGLSCCSVTTVRTVAAVIARRVKEKNVLASCQMRNLTTVGAAVADESAIGFQWDSWGILEGFSGILMGLL